MIRLRTVKPQRRIRADFKRHRLEGDEPRRLSGDVGGLKPCEYAVGERCAGIGKGRLDKGVVFGEEVELDKVAGVGGNEGGGVCEAVFANLDKVGDGGCHTAG